MGVRKKYKRKIRVNRRDFLRYVSDDDSEHMILHVLTGRGNG